MAKRKSRRMPKIAPAVTDLLFTTKTGDDAQPGYYIDTARALSRINRRKYTQSMVYAYQGLTFIWRPTTTTGVNALATIEVSVQTAPNTWITHNAHVKGEALWNQMQDLVLEDNPSIKGKWHQFIVRLDSDQLDATELEVRDGTGTEVLPGEWNKASYVLPQHDVAVSGDGSGIPPGEPLPAEEYNPVLVGASVGSRVSLTKAYQDSRATVSPDQPNTTGALPDGFFNRLTDSGSQEPELATLIEGENDNPPYDLLNYPGGDTNAPGPVTVRYAAVSNAEVDGSVGGFVAPCGLIKVVVKGYDTEGGEVPAADLPAIDLLLHVAPGTHRGAAAISMGQ